LTHRRPDATEDAPASLIGHAVPRLEDARLLTGQARFVDDVRLPGAAYMAILRATQPHARIASLDLAPALTAPGVLDAFSSADLGGEVPRIPLRLAPYKGFERFLQPVLATGKVRYVGEPVAAVVAENPYLAEDALARIAVEYALLPALVDASEAAASPTWIHDGAGENVATRYRVARGDVAAAFARAPYRRIETFRTDRQAPSPLETRGLVADFDGAAGRLRVWGATKVTYFNRRQLAATFGMSETDVELIEVDVGGGFGVRGELYPEDYLVAIASRRARRPVKWIEDRREHLMACNHSREIVCVLEIAAAKDGTILGMRGKVTGDMGAYIRTNGGVVPARAAQYLPGPYRVPAFECEVEAVVTNKTPMGTYRGPGRFEANFFRERLLDMMAADLGLDPAAVRQRNLLTPAEMPYRLGELAPGEANAAYDGGDYPRAFRRLLAEAGYDAWTSRQGEVSDGRRHGLGLACFVETAGAGPPEHARVTARANGRVEVRIGASALGQGTETAMAQVCASALGLPIDRIDVLHGTTSLLADGGGTFASRNTVMCGNAVHLAAEALKERCCELAALRWNTEARALVFAAGAVSREIEGEREHLTLAELAAFSARIGEGKPLWADGRFDNGGRTTYTYGAHAAHVAVDPETGEVEIKRYTVVEDIGRILNPMMVHGQAVGGVVQGLGGALLDRVVYGADGQLLTANLADYLLPTSTTAGDIHAITLEDAPSKLNPLGFKGAGEGGIVAVAAAVGNAIAAALAATNNGVRITRTPFDPESVLSAIPLC
jgi:carbon-monoxide dehydrogenase large subunit